VRKIYEKGPSRETRQRIVGYNDFCVVLSSAGLESDDILLRKLYPAENVSMQRKLQTAYGTIFKGIQESDDAELASVLKKRKRKAKA
jgi:hypothetical protein